MIELIIKINLLIKLQINTFVFLFALVDSLIGCYLCFVVSNTKGKYYIVFCKY